MWVRVCARARRLWIICNQMVRMFNVTMWCDNISVFTLMIIIQHVDCVVVMLYGRAWVRGKIINVCTDARTNTYVQHTQNTNHIGKTELKFVATMSPGPICTCLLNNNNSLLLCLFQFFSSLTLSLPLLCRIPSIHLNLSVFDLYPLILYRFWYLRKLFSVQVDLKNVEVHLTQKPIYNKYLHFFLLKKKSCSYIVGVCCIYFVRCLHFDGTKYTHTEIYFTFI